MWFIDLLRYLFRMKDEQGAARQRDEADDDEDDDEDDDDDAEAPTG